MLASTDFTGTDTSNRLTLSKTIAKHRIIIIAIINIIISINIVVLIININKYKRMHLCLHENLHLQRLLHPNEGQLVAPTFGLLRKQPLNAMETLGLFKIFAITNIIILDKGTLQAEGY